MVLIIVCLISVVSRNGPKRGGLTRFYGSASSELSWLLVARCQVSNSHGA